MARPTIRYREIMRIFLKAGSSSFGGWSSTAVQLEKELVTHHALLSAEAIKGAVTYAQIVPGATQVAIVAHAGYLLRGVRGAVAATASYLLPAICLVTLFSAIYFHSLRNTPHLADRLDGLIAALAGVIMANAYRIGHTHATRRILWLFVLLSGIAILFAHVHALLVLVVFGAGSVLLSFYSERKKAPAV